MESVSALQVLAEMTVPNPCVDLWQMARIGHLGKEIHASAEMAGKASIATSAAPITHAML